VGRHRDSFDPRTILAALERNYVNYVLIGGLARVLRGADEMTDGVDICPSFAADNLDRLGRAASELEGARADGDPLHFDASVLEAESPLTLSTAAGELKIIAAPVGAPNGFADLRRAATKEHLGLAITPHRRPDDRPAVRIARFG
jgi:hypothetical protein